MTTPPCYRIPPGVEFQRWHGGDEWVLYHSGTGETLRLSEAAMAVIDLLEQVSSMEQGALADALNALMDDPMPVAEISIALGELLRILISHECVEPATCA